MRIGVTKKSIAFFLIILTYSCFITNKQLQASGLLKVEPNPTKGFHWAYYLVTPNFSSGSSTILVIPNNTGTVDDDPVVHDDAARKKASDWSGFAENLHSPLIVPTFPRPYSNWWIYTHALDRDTLLTDINELERIDLQLIAMIEDAREILESRNIITDEKVYMMGFSAAGQFTSRFTILHPDKIKAAAIGAPGYPIVPVPSWEGENLRYCVGTYDLYDVSGKAFDLETFRKIPLYFFVGSQDTNDPVDYNDGFDQEDKDLINNLFGPSVILRWPKIQEVYNSVGSDSSFVMYNGVGHGFTSDMIDDVYSFFKSVRTTQDATGSNDGGGGGGGGCFISVLN